jgi:hypothetical protein
MMAFKPMLTIPAVLMASFLMSGQVQAASQAIPDCLEKARRLELLHDIPKGLLEAILIARAEEAGFGGRPHPYAVATEREHKVLASPKEVVAYVSHHKRDLTVRGGCALLQYNRHSRWIGVSKMMDADQGLEYLARFLVRMKIKKGGWTEAVGYTYSKWSWKQKPFVDRVACIGFGERCEKEPNP